MKIRKVYRFLLYLLLIFILFILLSRFFLPNPLFKNPYSTILYDRQSQLLGGRVANDGQWRFPLADSVPDKFSKALVLQEDRFFYHHPGFNPVSMLNALVDNIKEGRIVRGGSTLTMQVIRLSRNGQARTISEKLIELFYGIGLEIKHSKQEILSLYAGHAPFGGNVVGLEAASWRYFNRSAAQLSWAEAATLAVLPNAPSLIHPGKNRDLLLKKRDGLLHHLLQEGIIDTLTYELSLLETLPVKPYPMPQHSPHLLDYYWKNKRGTKVISTLDMRLQKKLASILSLHQQKLQANQVHNAAILVINPVTYEVMAYLGNTVGSYSGQHSNAVDMIRARRSTGSILKPLLYAAMIEKGIILPDAIVPDIPSYYENYHPENFDLTFEGVVPASNALSRSRNVPAVYMLRDYGIAPFLNLMRKTGLSSFHQPADYYGLTLILGGGEASLWELTNMYAGMVRTVINFDRFYGAYTGKEFNKPLLELDLAKNEIIPDPNVVPDLHAASVWMTFKALNKVKRPEAEAGWENFGSSIDIAWKTGTSYGFKDAWAVGSTADFVVGVWVGNADGEGREGLTGSQAAAPILFEVFNSLQVPNDLYPPYDELKAFQVCQKSGYRASRHCPEIDTIYSFIDGVHSKQCTFHETIFTDNKYLFRLSKQCASISEMEKVSWFTLPPVQEWYYRKKHPSYEVMPPFKQGCKPGDDESFIEFIYPMGNARIFIPLGIDNTQQEIIFEISHRYPSKKVFWHIDNTYIGQTTNDHQLGFIPSEGWHTLTVVDESGAYISVRFEIVNGD